jgi:hypothetical protein
MQPSHRFSINTLGSTHLRAVRHLRAAILAGQYGITPTLQPTDTAFHWQYSRLYRRQTMSFHHARVEVFHRWRRECGIGRPRGSGGR